MQLVIDIAHPVTPLERRVLALLLGDEPTETEEATPEPEKKAPAARPRKKAESAPDAPPAAEETPALDEDLLEQAIKRAKHLISVEKRGAEVKAALVQVGVEKVTHLDNNETIQAFLDALPTD